MTQWAQGQPCGLGMALNTKKHKLTIGHPCSDASGSKYCVRMSQLLQTLGNGGIRRVTATGRYRFEVMILEATVK